MSDEPKQSDDRFSPISADGPGGFSPFLKHILGVIEGIVLICDEEGIIELASSGVEAMLGYAPQDLVGRELSLLWSGAARVSDLPGCDGEEPDGGGDEANMEALHCDGHRIEVCVRSRKIERQNRNLRILHVVDRSDLAGMRARLREAEKALETMQVGVTITDCNRRILYVNPAEAAMHGYEVDELIGESVAVFAPERLWRELTVEDLKRFQSWRRESVNLRKDGSTFPVEILSDVVSDRDGEPTGIVTIAQDISERKHAEQALRESEERFALAARGANDGIWDWNITTGVVYFSPRWKLMLGCEEHEIRGQIVEWWDRVHPEDLPRSQERLDEHLAGDSDHYQIEHRMLHADGSYRSILSRGVAVRDAEGNPMRMAGSISDVTDQKVHDPLTGLPNRALFLDRLETALARAQRKKESLTAVLFLDLDRFKLVNDSLGHLAGDQLLVSVARRIESCIRPGDALGRLGGDEFTALLEELDSQDEALAVAERIHERLKEPFHLMDREVYASASIGAALTASGDTDPEELLSSADIAMYRAKSLGRGMSQMFAQEMRTEGGSQLELESDLRRAIERDEMRVFFQPIFHVTTGRISGFEALARWQHPIRGLQIPDDFIPAAEETGLIIPIGLWVLREACLQLGRWHREHSMETPLSMSVNLSAKQFGHPELVEQVGRVLNESGIPPECLQLEITESAVMDDPDAAVKMIEALQGMGVQVAIDDFGTGYSSLGSLHRLPVNLLKIDRSFVRTIDRPSKQVDLVQNIIRMAADLEIDVVAEGVETKDQQQSLEDMTCTRMQGYLFGRPMPAGKADELLRTQKR